MQKLLAFLIMIEVLAGCVSVPPPPNRSPNDPSDPSSPQAAARRYRPNLVASTKMFLDPSVGEGAQQMGMGGMEGMDHSKMQGMDHSNMPGMGTQQPSGQQSGGMKGTDHSKMPGMTTKPQSQTLDQEMKKTSDEMKKLSDELKTKSDAAKTGDKSQQQSQDNMTYTCVMHPEVKSDKPGDCPKCGMTLVQKSAAQ